MHGNRSLAWWTPRYVCILLQVLCTLGTEKAVWSGGKGEVGGRSDGQYRVSSSPEGGLLYNLAPGNVGRWTAGGSLFSPSQNVSLRVDAESEDKASHSPGEHPVLRGHFRRPCLKHRVLHLRVE